MAKEKASGKLYYRKLIMKIEEDNAWLRARLTQLEEQNKTEEGRK